MGRAGTGGTNSVRPTHVHLKPLPGQQLWHCGPHTLPPGPPVPLTPGDTPIHKKPDLFDDGDDVVAVLGFGDSPQAERKPTGEQ